MSSQPKSWPAQHDVRWETPQAPAAPRKSNPEPSRRQSKPRHTVPSISGSLGATELRRSLLSFTTSRFTTSCRKAVLGYGYGQGCHALKHALQDSCRPGDAAPLPAACPHISSRGTSA